MFFRIGDIMPNYKIADLTVNVDFEGNEIKSLAEKYKVESSTFDIQVKCSKSYLKKKQNENRNLTLDEIEEIFTLADFSRKLIDFDGIVFHASAIEYMGNAYLFSADSQVGKSTHTKLWQEYFGSDKVKIINDDKPVIRLLDGKIFVYGSPWTGGSGKEDNIKAPLKAIVFLERAQANNIIRVKDTDYKITNLLTQCKSRFPQKQTSRFMDIIEKIVKEIPIYKLQCNVSKDAVKTAYNIIAED